MWPGGRDLKRPTGSMTGVLAWGMLALFFIFMPCFITGFLFSSHFNSSAEETAIFIERNLMSRHLKGRSVGIVKAKDVFRYVFPHLDDFRRRGMLLEEKRIERGADKGKETGSTMQSYFPPEAVYTKFHGSKESLLSNAMKSSRSFNSQLLQDRRTRERFFDPNTQITQIPLGKSPFLPAPPPTQYPIAVMRGQFSDSFTDLYFLSPSLLSCYFFFSSFPISVERLPKSPKPLTIFSRARIPGPRLPSLFLLTCLLA